MREECLMHEAEIMQIFEGADQIPCSAISRAL